MEKGEFVVLSMLNNVEVIVLFLVILKVGGIVMFLYNELIEVEVDIYFFI